MDIPKTYILMCDCDEVQGQWKLKEGDHVYWRSGGDVNIFTCDDVFAWTMDEIKTEHGGGICLPQQHQLWDMVAYSMNCIHERGYWCRDCFEAIGSFMRADHPSILNIITSKETCLTREVVLLAYYMWMEHGKIWESDKWTEQMFT